MKEVIHALETIKEREVIENFIKRQDMNGCNALINALRYTSGGTEDHWMEIYTKLFRDRWK